MMAEEEGKEDDCPCATGRGKCGLFGTSAPPTSGVYKTIGFQGVEAEPDDFVLSGLGVWFCCVGRLDMTVNPHNPNISQNV